MQEGVRLPDEVVVEVGAPGVARRRRRRAPGRSRTTADRRPGRCAEGGLEPARRGQLAVGPASRGAQGGVAILALTSSLFPRRQVVAGDIDPGARGRPQPRGAGRSLRALAASPALIVLLLAGSRTATDYRIRPLPRLGLRDRPVVLCLVGADAGRSTVRPASTRTPGFADYPPGLPLPPVAHRPARRRRPPTPAAVAIGPRQAAADRSSTSRSATSSTASCWAGPGPGRRAERLALAAAALYVFNPVTFYDSALWGQTDAAGALVAAPRRRGAHPRQQRGRGAWRAVAALVKPQFGVVLVPLVGRRAPEAPSVAAGLGTAPPPWAPRAARGLARRPPGRRCGCVTSIVVGLVVFLAIALPFGIGPVELPGRMAEHGRRLRVPDASTPSTPGRSSGRAATPSLAVGRDAGRRHACRSSGPVPGVAHRRRAAGRPASCGARCAPRSATTAGRSSSAAAFLAIAFFVLPTRVHERYLFPAVRPPAAPRGRRSGRWLVALVLAEPGLPSSTSTPS